MCVILCPLPTLNGTSNIEAITLELILIYHYEKATGPLSFLSTILAIAGQETVIPESPNRQLRRRRVSAQQACHGDAPEQPSDSKVTVPGMRRPCHWPEYGLKT